MNREESCKQQEGVVNTENCSLPWREGHQCLLLASNPSMTAV